MKLSELLKKKAQKDWDVPETTHQVGRDQRRDEDMAGLLDGHENASW